MIINRNIKASGAILVCDNPHTLVSTTLTCRYHGNTSYVIMSPHPADIEPRHMSTPAYSGNVTCWLLYQPFGSYIRKESPAERNSKKASLKPSNREREREISPHTHAHAHAQQWFSSQLVFQHVQRVEAASRESHTENFLKVCVLKTAPIKWKRRSTARQAERTGTCRTGPSLSWQPVLILAGEHLWQRTLL